MNTTRRSFMKNLSVASAVAGSLGVSGLARAAVDADLTEKVITIVNANYPSVSAYPDVVRAFAVALQKAETPRMESLTFVISEGSKGGELFERYVSIEFSVATNVLELDANRKLELLWK
jgi:hypothetical protein